MKKKFYYILMTLLVAMLSIGFVACDKDDDESAPIPSNLIGTWYKVSGAYKYSLNFTFYSDGTGEGYASRANNSGIASYSSFWFTYKYKSNGDIVCDYSRAMVDSNGEDTAKGTMIFNYSGSKLTLNSAPNISWEGSEFSKD